MQMRGALMRVLRIVLVAVLAWLAFSWLAPQGLGWLVPVVAGVLALAWIGWRAVVVRRRRARDAQSDRWAEALMMPAKRPAAIEELRRELAASKGDAAGHARLTLVLAELLEADGDPSAALEALAAIDEGALGDVLGAIVRHARAVSHLSAGDPAEARAALDELPGPCGDRAVDLRLRMMRGLIAAEAGDGKEALEVARIARDEAGPDKDLALEARVLEAVGHDVLGDRDRALTTMARIGEEMLAVLAVLGLPRVRTLATEALDAADDSADDDA